MRRFFSASIAGGVFALLLAILPVAAETKLADLNGEWLGAGSDRFLPIESFQSTNCNNTIRADARRIICEMTCNGKSGLRKIVRMTATLDSDQIEGSVTQSISKVGDTSTTEMNGSMLGKKVGDTASFNVSWAGLWPPTSVNLVLHDPSSYTMQVTSLGLTIMDVKFKRVRP